MRGSFSIYCDFTSKSINRSEKTNRSVMDTKDFLDISPSNTHILAFPFPAKGHINPMLHLCKRLASKGLKITLVTTVSAYKGLKTNANSFMINIESIPDGAEETTNWDVYFKTFRASGIKNMTEFIEKHKKSDCPPKVVIYDSMMPWMLEITKGFGLRGACFFTQSCSVNAFYYHMHHGAISTPLEESTVSLPCLPPLESNDQPGFKFFNDYTEVIANLHSNQFSNIEKMDYILFNTFHDLEVEVADWMASKWSILTVGPTVPSLLGKQQKDKDEGRNYLFETNTEICLKWLDKRATDSVIYVSFGSFASLEDEQMEEVAQGLVRSNCNFVWVVRDEEESKLPKDFKSNTSEKGLIINWCPQLHVLAHRAVACFMTHCGWNSTLEALGSGVSMIAMPVAVDQTTNAKFIADVWETGVRVKANKDGIVTREEIEHCIREVTKTEKGKELKRNALKWKKLTKEAVSKGGSSDRNIEEFASELLF